MIRLIVVFPCAIGFFLILYSWIHSFSFIYCRVAIVGFKFLICFKIFLYLYFLAFLSCFWFLKLLIKKLAIKLFKSIIIIYGLLHFELKRICQQQYYDKEKHSHIEISKFFLGWITHFFPNVIARLLSSSKIWMRPKKLRFWI